MVQTRWIATTAVFLLLLGSCDRFKQSARVPEPAPPPTAPASPATAALPTTVPVEWRSLRATERGASVVYEFPAACLHVDRYNKELYLYSKDADDSAIGQRNGGNSYYIPLTTENFDEFLQRLDAGQTDEVEFHLKSSTAEFNDANFEGITVAQRYRLQAVGGVVRMQGSGQVRRIAINGKFLKFDTEADTQTATAVNVSGTLLTVVEPALSAPVSSASPR